MKRKQKLGLPFVCFLNPHFSRLSCQPAGNNGNSFALIVNRAVCWWWKEAVGGCQQQYLTSESALNPGAGESGNKEGR